MISFFKGTEKQKLCGSARSPKWPEFRKNFLKGKSCAVCGGVDMLELHHIKPFHLHPELELDPNNVLPLCESQKNGVTCHLFIGHLGNYKSINPDVIEDARLWSHKMSLASLLLKSHE